MLQSEILARHLVSAIKTLGEWLQDKNKKPLIERFYDRWLTQESADLKSLNKAYRRSRKKRKNQLEIPLVKLVDYDVTIHGERIPPTETFSDTATISGTNIVTTITV